MKFNVNGDIDVDEKHYSCMEEDAYYRPAQIPILRRQFTELTKDYYLSDDNRWIVFNHSDHFLVYSTNTHCCIFDAFYSMLNNDNEAKDKEDSIIAVIYNVKICANENQYLDDLDCNDVFEILVKIFMDKQLLN